MKKKVVLFGIFFLVVMLPFLLAEENSTDSTELIGVDKAYNCLEKRIEDKCSTLSYDEKIFSLLAVGKCKQELIDDSKNSECFPASSCKIKTTAQAILALDKAGTDTADYENWLFLQNKSPLDVVWYLQIDSSEATACTIKYSGSTYSVVLGSDKKFLSGAGCFSLAAGGYWLEISPTCYSEEFEISCDKQFLTSLLFKKKDSPKIYVSENTNPASAEGTTKEKVNSYCFGPGGNCDYEGSLWATLVLDYLDYDISTYMPYLITMAEGNPQYIPEAFLYLLTDDTDYRIDLLEKQKTDFWDESGDKFYDTALALYPFQYEEPTEKTASMEWLLDAQDNQGCWKGNIRNTAFLLYSVWPKAIEPTEPYEPEEDCEIDAGGFCMSGISCEEAGGSELYSYSSTCSGLNVCCDKEKELETCEELNGEECVGGEVCSTSTIEASDISECCLGYCREAATKTDCERYGNVCRDSCTDDEQETVDECDAGEVCCTEKTVTEKNYWWIWVLLILIVLVLIGIIFRDKLRPYWFRLTGGKKSPPKNPPRRGFPSPYGMRRMPQRRIIPRSTSSPQARAPLQKRKSSELDSVLKKLRDIGK